MKKSGTIIGILLLFLIAGSGCHNRRHDRREIKDYSGMMTVGMRHHFRSNRDFPNMRGMMDQGMRNRFGRGMGPGMGFGMMRGMGRMPLDSIGWMPMAPGRRILESIPNVTENQKKQIEDLTRKHSDEMKKLREEMFSKMQSLMISNRKEMLNVLTDEQKKFLDSERGIPAPVQEKEKQ